MEGERLVLCPDLDRDLQHSSFLRVPQDLMPDSDLGPAQGIRAQKPREPKAEVFRKTLWFSPCSLYSPRGHATCARAHRSPQVLALAIRLNRENYRGPCGFTRPLVTVQSLSK